MSMTINVKYLGMIADIVRMNDEEVPVDENSKISDFLDELYSNHTNLKSIDFRVALNQKLVDKNTLLSSKDELALLPPFAGG